MATIRYTLDGSTPSSTHGFIYTAPFVVSETAIVRAVTYGDDLEDSEVVEVTYFILPEPEQPEVPEPEEQEGECVGSTCLTPTSSVPTCILPLTPVVVCITQAEPTHRCGNDRLEDECPEGSTGEVLFIDANTYFASNVDAANVLAQAALDALRLASPCVFENEEQTAIDNCPEGTVGETVSYTVEAGDDRFTSTVSQEAANAAALAYAEAQVALLRAASPCEVDDDEVFPTFILSCRSQEGVATICGFSEFADPSIPPKKYRTDTIGGIYEYDYFGPASTTCAPPRVGYHYGWYAGIRQYDINTCEVAGSVTIFTDVGGTSGGHLMTTIPASVGLIVTNTKTQSLAASDGLCYLGVPGPVNFTYTTVTLNAQLTNEDTEEDAVTRLEAAEWVDWDTLSWNECELPDECCETERSLRGAGEFSFNTKETQSQVEASALTPSTSYDLHVIFWRENLDTLVDELAEEQVFIESTDGGGNAVWNFNVPAVAGYRYYIKELRFFPT